MEKRGRLNILGTQPSPQNSQLLVSSGIPMLDELLDEDTYGTYARTILKYFLAEGVVNKHAGVVASLDCDPKDDFVNQLPLSTSTDLDAPVHSNKTDGKMTIAFRYNHLPTQEKVIKPKFGHYYDLSKTMPADQLEKSEFHYYSESSSRVSSSSDELRIFNNDSYDGLIRTIVNTIKNEKFILDDNFDVKNVLRVCVHKLGSPQWGPDEELEDVKKCIFYLKCLVRKSFSIALITIPTYLSEKLHNIYENRLVHICDIAIGLEVFAGTKLEKNKSLSDYHGFFFVTKLSAINSLTSKHPGPVEYVFKLKRKKFSIEKLHLPPDIQEINDSKRKSETPSLGCGSSTKHLMEF